jgi:hypothetical protein
VDGWHWLLFGGAAALLVHALQQRSEPITHAGRGRSPVRGEILPNAPILDPCPGVSARAVELLLAGVAVVLLGTTAKYAAEGTDERWTLEPPRDGP